MLVVTLTCDRYLHLLRGHAFLFNKFWSELQSVLVCGFTPPSFDLPRNFRFTEPKAAAEVTTALPLVVVTEATSNFAVPVNPAAPLKTRTEAYWAVADGDAGPAALAGGVSIRPDGRCVGG